MTSNSHPTGDEGGEAVSLWESALQQVGSSKAVATKTVLVLGDSNCGKTNVVSQLFQASLHPQTGNGQGSNTVSTAIGTSDPLSEIETLVTLSKHDLALSYSYMDVRDEDNEETIARLGIYQLASDRTTDRELLKYVLDARTFGDAAAVIVLDWSKPWRFVKSLLRWCNVLTEAIESVCRDTGGREAASNKGASGWTLGKATVDECRERLERFLQEYVEPAEPGGEAAAGAGAQKLAAKAVNVLLPLAKGVLEENLGLPLIVVCTKADSMAVLERERAFKEEDFDYIQQILRAVCLRFGAALVYTSTHNPATFSALYHYLVHRLLSTPTTLAAASTDGEEAQSGESPDDDTDDEANKMDVDAVDEPARDGVRARAGSTATVNAPAAAQNAGAQAKYPFRLRANVVDRDVVLVPAGWDSTAQIKYLRDSFDVAAVQGAWEFDVQRYQAIVDRATREASATAPMRLSSSDANNAASLGIAMQVDAEPPTSNNSMLVMFGEVVSAPKRRAGRDADGSSTVAAVAAAAAGIANHVAVEDDQSFLERLYVEQEEQMKQEGEDGAGYSDVRPHVAGGASNKFVSNLLRSMHSAESSLSTAIDVPSPREPNSGNVSDDGDDFDSVDSSPLPNNSVSRYPPVSANTLSQLREGEIGGSLGRNAGSRATRPVASSDQPQHGTIRRKLTIGSAHKQQASGDAGSSNEELTSFFQSLLGRKGGVASVAASNSGKSSPQQPPPRQLGTASLSRSSTTGSHRDVQAEFERLKTQLNRSKE